MASPISYHASYGAKPDTYYENDRPEMLRFVPSTAKRTLELGCGSGGFSAALKGEGPRECWGIELDNRAAQAASQRLDRVIAGEATAVMPELPDGYFDCIIMNDVLEHLTDPFSLLRDLHGKLRSDGVIVASVPNVRFWNHLRDYVWRGDWDYREAGILDSTHLRFFTFKSLKKMFAALGYEIVRIEGLKPTRNKKYRLLNVLLFNRLWDARYHQFACVVRPAAGSSHPG